MGISGGISKRQLGRTGLEVSALGFGCGAVGGLMVKGEPGDQRRAVEMALDAGITYFDTAPSYGDGASEENLGRVVRELGVRDQVVVGTKVRFRAEDLADPRAAVLRSIDASLKRLRLPHVQLIQVHNPVGDVRGTPSGDGVPAERMLDDVAEAMTGAVEAGLAEHVGFTGFGDTAGVLRVLAHPSYETVQAYLNVLNPSGLRAGAAGGQQDFEGLLEKAAQGKAGVIAIRVLAAGALSAAAERHPIASAPPSPLVRGAEYESDVERARRLQVRAIGLGLESTLELALRFALSAASVGTALVGLSTVDQLAAAIRWAQRGPLEAAAVEDLLALART